MKINFRFTITVTGNQVLVASFMKPLKQQLMSLIFKDKTIVLKESSNTLMVVIFGRNYGNR
jgi:hypothetical protein